MEINIKINVLDFFGKPIKTGDEKTPEENRENLTLGEVILDAVNLGGKPDESTEGKVTRYLLGMRIGSAILGDGQLSLTAKETVMIRDGVSKRYTPMVVGFVLSIIDPEELKMRGKKEKNDEP